MAFKGSTGAFRKRVRFLQNSFVSNCLGGYLIAKNILSIEMMHLGLENVLDREESGIYNEAGKETTYKIQNMLDTFKNVLLICEDKSSHVYTNIADLTEKPVYDLVKKREVMTRILAPVSKFMFLAQFGCIKKSWFTCIILRVGELRKDLVHCFRQFYYGGTCLSGLDLAETHNIRVSVFLEKIGEKDPLVLGLRNQTVSDDAFLFKRAQGSFQEEKDTEGVLCMSRKAFFSSQLFLEDAKPSDSEGLKAGTSLRTTLEKVSPKTWHQQTWRVPSSKC